MNKEIKLSVNDLKVSFRTDAGKVQAVRNISFDLYKGETLAIVGESGSGKSVTSKAIMGISAGNSIYEGGEILYDGQDLTRIPEEEMHKLRGDKIAMIFQDPLSSLNPIMRIGKQITEAMLLKNKASRKEGRVTFKKTLASLADAAKKAIAEKPQTGFTAAEVESCIKTFHKCNTQGVKPEQSFMNSFTAIVKLAVQYSFEKNIFNKKLAVEEIEKTIAFFKAGGFTAQTAKGTCESVKQRVAAAIDPLAIVKDNVAYTFGSTLDRDVEKYFFYVKNNPKEEARFARQTAQRDALLAKGKKVEWKIVPKSVIELDVLIEAIVSVLTRVLNKFKADIASADGFDADKRCNEIVDYLYEQAAQIRYVLTKGEAQEKAIKLMEEVGIPEARVRFRQYPFEFSGGMRQRIVIAIALSANPDVLICDEPTTALDVTIQAQILELINRLKKERNLSIIFITHDLGVVANMADRIAVMYAGKIVEYGTAEEIFYNPQHPYTWALLSSMPDLDTNEKLDAIPGTPPNMIYPPVGDAFAARNKYAMEIDFEMEPPMYEVSPTHHAATWLLHPNAPKVEIPKIITERVRRMKERGGNHGE